MSDESITHKEDKEDLLYIATKINMEELTYGEEHSFVRESVTSETSVVSQPDEVSDEDSLFPNELNAPELGPQIWKDPAVALKTRPFNLMWCYGINPKVNIINLTNSEDNRLFFACTHFPIIYDYCKKLMYYLEGHHHLITSISVDNSGRWLVTADNGKDGCLNIWDGLSKNIENDKKEESATFLSQDEVYCPTQGGGQSTSKGRKHTLMSFPSTQHLIRKILLRNVSGRKSASFYDHYPNTPVLSMYEVYKNYGISTAQISPSARYLITIGGVKEDCYSLDMWLWTLGNDVPEDSFLISNTHGYPVTVCFNPNIEEHIKVVFSKQVFLFVWDMETKMFTHQVTPQIMHRAKIGHLTSGTYVDKCHECYTTSSKGCILIFGNTLYAKPFEEGELDNNKIFRNAVKISDVPIHCCTSIDGLVVTGDALGRIYFFNKRLMILYWLTSFNLGPIASITFSLIPKLKIQDMKYYMVPTKEDSIMNCDFVDMMEELELLFKKDIPTDATMQRQPFIVRDFFVATAHCNIYSIDVINNKCIPLFHTADDFVVAVEAHKESDFVIVAYKSNRLILMNYITNEVISENILPKSEDENVSISCLRYSFESFHLVCGKTNGEIWILEPMLLTPKEGPIQITKNKIMKICFSFSPPQFAYYDNKRRVVIFQYNTNGKWEYKGKIRPHYEDITDIMFVPDKNGWKLYTIGKDRHIVEYNNENLDSEEFKIQSAVRTEQTAVPLSFLYWVNVVKDKQFGYILVSDDKHKLKFLYHGSKVPKSIVLAPAFGCFKNQLIRKMQIIPDCQSKYMAFCTNRHFGLHILPPDGNPYKYVGYLAHPVKLEDFAVSRDGQYIFTFGANDHCVIKWRIETKAVEYMKRIGGKELQPFYCLIEGGYHGWLFHEIKDLFYYMQILQQENIDLPRRVSDSINYCEIPDLFRTLGFYPTDYDIENIMVDVKYRYMDETGIINQDINFIDFVKLYCNHKPVYGYSQDELTDAFHTVADFVAGNNVQATAIPREEFLDVLTTQGESGTMTSAQAFKCFKTLMRKEDIIIENFNFLPESINFWTLFEDILGIDMERDKVLEPEASSDEEVRTAQK